MTSSAELVNDKISLLSGTATLGLAAVVLPLRREERSHTDIRPFRSVTLFDVGK
jgi:hypothetical protein